MCRLYGISGNQPARVECSLLDAQNALITQSVEDSHGVANPDGWGIGSYEKGQTVVHKSARAASHDTRFRRTAEDLVSRTVVAHVRAATVGANSLDNTHPFSHGPWLFAHNGTLAEFHRLADGLVAEIPEYLLRSGRGDTDSELIFLWLLAKMPDFGLDPLSGADSAHTIVELLAAAVPELARRSAEVTGDPAKLNFLLSDGVHLAASRWGNTLFLAERVGRTDCEVCATTHLAGRGESAYRAVVIASEPITREAWTEVPDRSFVGVTSGRLVTTAGIPLAA